MRTVDPVPEILHAQAEKGNTANSISRSVIKVHKASLGRQTH